MIDSITTQITKRTKGEALFLLLGQLLVFVAVALRLLMYFQNRSLFLDTLNLARNYAERGYQNLLGSLDYDQHAPPLFNWAVKFCTDVFGMQEYALRLFPLLVALGSLYLFYALARYFLGSYAFLFALILFGFSTYVVEYSTTVKQYSGDVFFTCLFLFLAIKYPVHKDNFSKNRGFFWALGGALALWFSMPTVFVLAGVGMYFIVKNYSLQARIKKTTFLKLGLIFGVWLLSFTLLFFVNIRHSISSDHLQGFHAQFFLLLDNPVQTGEVLVGIIRSIVGKTALPIVGGFLFLFLGCFKIFKKDKAEFVLLLTPVLACLFAALLQKYSLIIRLTLFLFPILILLMSIGFQQAYAYFRSRNRIVNRVGQITLFVLAFLCCIGRSGVPYFFEKYSKEEGRIVLQVLEEKVTSQQTIFISEGGVAAFKFYTQHYHYPLKIDAKNYVFQNESQAFQRELLGINEKEFWYFDSHTFGGKLEQQNQFITKEFQIKKEYKAKFARACLLKR